MLCVSRASHSCGFDADIMRNIAEQQRENQKREEELAVKMREIDGQQKTQEKRKKRQEKKEKVWPEKHEWLRSLHTSGDLLTLTLLAVNFEDR